MFRKILRYLLYFVAAYLLFIIGTLVHGTITDWQPEDRINITLEQESTQTIISDSTISLVTWNIGFGGLGAESDFFYDNGGYYFSHGQMIRSPKELVEKNVLGAEKFTQVTPADFFLFQEVDVNSKRSYFTNEFDRLRAQAPEYAAAFATNYKVSRVPIPTMEPWRAYGKVHSGLATLSKYQPKSSERMQFPGSFDWPTRIFQLDRCLLLQRFETAFSGDLVIINTHLSAYDKGGIMKKQQMDFLKELVQKEYAEGNYVIVGADWNQCPPFFAFDTFSPGNTDGHQQLNIADDFLPEEWLWIYDPTTPTNRKTKMVYEHGKTFTTLIDFYLISPNLKAVETKAVNHKFDFSDHQAVRMEVSFE